MAVTSWVKKLVGASLTLDTLETLLLEQIKDLYSAENQLIEALPKMAAGASTADLKKAFQSHLNETKTHKTRLEKAFRELGHEPEDHTCEAMKGLITEGDSVLSADGDPKVKDAAIIAAAQRVEHYEMAGYGCARTFANQLGHESVADLLQETLDEEAAADEKLTKIAETLVNPKAAKVKAKV